MTGQKFVPPYNYLRITDNGQPEEITAFERHASAGPELKRESLPEEEKIVSPTPIPPPQAMERKFFPFFDFASERRGDSCAKSPSSSQGSSVIK
jgi:hypothetical protein